MANGNLQKCIAEEKMFVVSGAPVNVDSWTKRKAGRVYTREEILREEILDSIKVAKSYNDLNKIGDKLAYAKDNDYDVGLFDCTYKASKKMREIYNKLGEYRGE